jgi:hypothetical protein
MRVFIHGSCVSRDLLPLLSPHEFQLNFYSPRQSLIPLLGHIGGLEEHLNATNLTSRFQRRAIEGTLRADVLDRLKHHHGETDLVLWDLTDERLGVYEFDGRYMTRSLELISSGLDVTLASMARHIAFGTDEHFDLWASALDLWKRSLTRLRLVDRLVLLAPPWATHLNDGSPTPPSFGTHAIEHAFLAERYYALARSTFPKLHFLGHGSETRASQNHQWGPAPFHYDEGTSARLAHALRGLVYEDVAAFPPPRPIVAPVGPRTVEVTVPKTWAESVALYALQGGQVAVRSGYQDGELFRVRLPEPGEYVFRAFHRALGRAVCIDSERVSPS